MRICPYCGAKVSDNDQICATCGAVFGNETTQQSKGKKKATATTIDHKWSKQLAKYSFYTIAGIIIIYSIALVIFLNHQASHLQNLFGHTTYSLTVPNVQYEKKKLYFLLGSHENQAYYVNDKKSAQEKVFYEGLQSSYHFDNHSLIIMESTKDNAVILTIYLKDIKKTHTGFVAQGRVLGHTISDTFNTETDQSIHLTAVK